MQSGQKKWSEKMRRVLRSRRMKKWWGRQQGGRTRLPREGARGCRIRSVMHPRFWGVGLGQQGIQDSNIAQQLPGKEICTGQGSKGPLNSASREGVVCTVRVVRGVYTWNHKDWPFFLFTVQSLALGNENDESTFSLLRMKKKAARERDKMKW
jgi:hypothetical protein